MMRYRILYLLIIIFTNSCILKEYKEFRNLVEEVKEAKRDLNERNLILQEIDCDSIKNDTSLYLKCIALKIRKQSDSLISFINEIILSINHIDKNKLSKTQDQLSFKKDLTELGNLLILYRGLIITNLSEENCSISLSDFNHKFQEIGFKNDTLSLSKLNSLYNNYEHEIVISKLFDIQSKVRDVESHFINCIFSNN